MKGNLVLIACIAFLPISIFAQNNLEIIQAHLNNSAASYNLKPNDVQNWVITDEYMSKNSNITHIYLRQTYEGIEVRNAISAIHLTRNGRVLKMYNNFVHDLDEKIANSSAAIDASEALQNAAQQMNYNTNSLIRVLEAPTGVAQEGLLNASQLSRRDIKTKLIYEPLENGTFTLAWNMPVYELDQNNWWDMRIDASTGHILSKDNWVKSCNWDSPSHDHSHAGDHSTHHHHADRPSPLLPHATYSSSSTAMVGAYNVYAAPIESPNFGNGRTIVTDPDDAVASPFGWHDTDGVAGAEFTTTQGNNCHAYEDGDNQGFSPNGGAGLNFDFPFNPTYSNGDQSEAAALTNLFYWTNLVHDVWYRHGFDEASGNFQENNYGNGGVGGDYVFAEAQDGSGTCNANFATPTDGGNPTMQMYVCNSHDGDVDNGVIVHEYGHGISIRLTGGPGNSSCLNNTEQMGEGWSDWFGMVMTIEHDENGVLTDAGADPRGMGTWLLSQAPDGPGIRSQRYSTNMSVNNYTYNSINTEVAPHGVGSVWCMMLWEMTWALIEKHGFDANLHTGTGGNNMAMALVIEGLKLQPCSPGFVDGRDAILLADENLYGGANQCLIWEAFAKRGLGFSADQGSTDSKTDGTEAFDVAPSCNISLEKTVDKTIVEPAETLTYTLTATNTSNMDLSVVVIRDDVPVYTTYNAGSASDGGSETGGVVSFPAVDLAVGESITRTFSVTVNVDAPVGQGPLLEDDMENGSGNWVTITSGASDWVLEANNPNSGTMAWFAQNIPSTALQYLTLVNPVVPTASSTLDFYHNYDTEATWDGGTVEISTNNGDSWSDLGSLMTINGYNSTVNNNTPGFSGNSGGYVQTSVNLASFDGQSVIFRFVMNTDGSVAGNGWFIDDVSVSQVVKIPNIANVSTAEGLSTDAELAEPTCIFGEVIPIINFQSATIDLVETATAAPFNDLVGNCRPFTNHPINVVISADPDSPVNLEVNLVSSQATDVEDFELIVNTITVASAGTYPLALRVYDDANIEGTETINLDLALTNAGATNATLGTNTTMTVSISDDDTAPSGAPIVSIDVDEDIETDDGGLISINSGGNDWKSGTVGDADSNDWTVPSNGSNRLFYVNDDACNCDMSNVKLVIPSVDLANKVGASLHLDVFFEGNEYQGITETAQIEVSIDGGTTFTTVATINGTVDVWRNENYDLSAYIGNRDVIVAIQYSDNTGWLYGFAVDNIKIMTEEAGTIDIANEIVDIDEQYVGTNSDVYFYDNRGAVIARIQNGSHNFGCVEVAIDRAGTDATNFQDNVRANQLADKTFLFTPEFNSTTADYMVTLYYTQDEVAGWETATGHTWSDAQVIKNPSSVTNITPANPEPDGPNTVQVQISAANGNPSFTPTNYFITAEFTNGFSGMGVGNPGNVLPIELLEFTGEHIAAKGNLIQWTTASEIDNDFFILERSFGGHAYEQIAKIEAANLTTNQINYDFLDTEYRKGDNYYRLTQQDVNGQRAITSAININVKSAADVVTIFPNPTQGVVHVTFDEALTTKVELELLDALGRVVKRQTFDANNFNFDMNTLSNGVYHLSLNYNGTQVQQKIVKTAN